MTLPMIDKNAHSTARLLTDTEYALILLAGIEPLLEEVCTIGPTCTINYCMGAGYVMYEMGAV